MPRETKGVVPNELLKPGAENESEGLSLEIGRLICENAKKINEGNNGVIFEIGVEVAGENLKRILIEQGIEVSENQVLKMLKIYRPGYGRREFEIQQAAYQALRFAGEVARIPKPIFYLDLQLDDKTLNYLKSSGLNFPGGRAEILLMDLIPGADLATVFFRQALMGLQPENYPDLASVSTLPFNTLQSEVVSSLGFKKPGGESSNEGERNFEARKVETENAKKLFDFLRKKGFVLPTSILDKMEKTIRLLHSQGIFHRDLHERNIMVSGDLTNEENLQVYLLDFGSAKIITSEQDPDVYKEGDVGLQDDLAILNRLRPLTVSLQDERRLETDKNLEVLRKAIVAREKDPHILNQVAIYKGRKINADFLEGILDRFQTKPTEDFFALLEILKNNGSLPKEEILTFISQQKIAKKGARGGVTPFWLNKLQEYRRLLTIE